MSLPTAIRPSRIVPLCAVLSLHAALDGCGRRVDDPFELVPADVAAALDVDAAAFVSSETGRAVAGGLLPGGAACLRPLLGGEGKRRLVVGYGAGRKGGGLPFVLLHCPACGADALRACLASDFGVAWNGGLDYSYRGVAFAGAEAGATSLLFGRAAKGVFFVGGRDEAGAVVDTAKGSRPALAAGPALARLRAAAPAGAFARLVVLDGARARKLAPFLAAAPDLREGSAGVAFTGGGGIVAAARFAPAGGATAGQVAELKKNLAQTAASPLVKKLGVSHYIEKLTIGEEEGGWFAARFELSRKEVAELLELHDVLLKIGL